MNVSNPVAEIFFAKRNSKLKVGACSHDDTKKIQYKKIAYQQFYCKFFTNIKFNNKLESTYLKKKV